MPIKKMTVSEWIKVTDNPIQRDTERHAARAKHLLTPLAVHAIVFAAELPSGKLVKLDGHTRALMWSRNQMKPPAELTVNVIPVKDLDEARVLYKAFDAKEAVETASDKVTGGFNDLGFAPASALLQTGNITVALKSALAVLHGYAATGGGVSERKDKFDIYSAIIEFQNELYALDSFKLCSGYVKAGVVGAFLITYRRHGRKAIPFWTAYFGDGGERRGGWMDGVQALREFDLSRKGKGHGGSATFDLLSRAVAALEKWLKDENFTAIPRPFNMDNYLANCQRPETVLIKAKKVA